MNTREIQQALVNLGQPIIVDGIIGPQTRNAIRNLQTKYFVTGEADKRTIDLLKSLQKTPPPTPKRLQEIVKNTPLNKGQYIEQNTPKGAIT